MMLFSELYSAYYNTVAQILKRAVKGELTEEGLKKIVSAKAFGESGMTIPSALKNGKWQLITRDLKTPLQNEPRLPLTILQKRWLKAISLDPRVKLFGYDFSGLENVEPLFTPEMVCYYDQYADGDDFEDEGYISRFQTILEAIKAKQALKLTLETRKGKRLTANVMPEYLEYSEKDDKFRLITSRCKYVKVANLSNLTECKPYYGTNMKASVKPEARRSKVTFTLFDGRNTLERAMLHFAHFEKTVEKTDEDHYLVSLTYDTDDEIEILIRILSFGPFIKVIEPESFVNKLKNRLKMQKSCEI